MSEKLAFKEFYKNDPRKRAIERAISLFNKKKKEYKPNKSDGFKVRSISESRKRNRTGEVSESASPFRSSFSQLRDDKKTDGSPLGEDASAIDPVNTRETPNTEDRSSLGRIINRAEFQINFFKARNSKGFEKLKGAWNPPIEQRPKSSNAAGNNSSSEGKPKIEQAKLPQATLLTDKTLKDNNKTINTRFKILGLLVEKKIKENSRIDEMLKTLKEKKIKDVEFHERIRRNFFVTRDIRKEIDKNFETLNTEYNLNNYILVKKLEKVLLSNCPCFKEEDEHRFKLESEADYRAFPGFEKKRKQLLETANPLRKEGEYTDPIGGSKFSSDIDATERSGIELSSYENSIPPSSERTAYKPDKENLSKINLSKTNAFRLNSQNQSAERKVKDEIIYYKKRKQKEHKANKENSNPDVVQKFKIEVNGTKSVTFSIEGKTSEIFLNDISSAEVVFSSRNKTFTLFDPDQHGATETDVKHSPEIYSKFKSPRQKEPTASAVSSDSETGKERVSNGIKQIEEMERNYEDMGFHLSGNFSDTLKFDPRNAYIIFMEMSKLEEKNKAVKKLCMTCTKKKELLIDFVFEIFKIDVFAEKETDSLSEIFEKLADERNEIDIVKINKHLWQFSHTLRRALKKSQEVLPHFAIFYERLFKVMLFFNEVIMNRLQQSIARMLYELEENKIFIAERNTLNRDLNLVTAERDKLKKDVKLLQEAEIAREALYQGEISELIKRLSETNSLTTRQVESSIDLGLNMGENLQKYIVSMKREHDDQTKLIEELVKTTQKNYDIWAKTASKEYKGTQTYNEQDLLISECWRLPLAEIQKLTLTMKRRPYEISITKANLLKEIHQMLAFYSYQITRKKPTPRQRLKEENISKFQFFIMEFLSTKELYKLNFLQLGFATHLLENLVNQVEKKSLLADPNHTNSNSASLKIFRHFFSINDAAGKKLQQVTPFKTNEEKMTSFLQKMFPRIFMSLYMLRNKSVSKFKHESCSTITFSIKQAVSLYFQLYGLEDSREMFEEFLGELFEQDLTGADGKRLADGEKVLSIIGAQIAFKYTFSDLMATEFFRKIFKKVMLDAADWTEKIYSENFSINSQYFFSKGENYEKANTLTLFVAKQKKKKQESKEGDSGKKKKASKYDAEEYRLFNKLITAKTLWILFNKAQITTNIHPYFSESSQRQDQVIFNLFVPAGKTELRGGDLIKVLETYILDEKRVQISLCELASLLTESLRKRIERFPEKLHSLFNKYNLSYKGGVEKNSVIHIIQPFDFHQRLKQHDCEIFLRELEYWKFNKTYSATENFNEQVTIVNEFGSEGSNPTFSLENIEATFNIPTLLDIYKKSILKSLSLIAKSPLNKGK